MAILTQEVKGMFITTSKFMPAKYIRKIQPLAELSETKSNVAVSLRNIAKRTSTILEHNNTK